jgi:type IX secretion system PorP/SprF family membrane protein
MYSQYVFNGLLINPAYAGSREVLSATVLYRNQWVNIPGAPKTGVFSLDSPVKNQKVGLGLNMVFDKIGVTTRTSVSGIYSYKLYFEQSSLSFGLQAGVGFFNTNNSEVNYSNSSNADPAFMTDYHMVVPNFGFGTYYHSDRFFAGFSIMNILGSAIQDKFNSNVANDMTMNTVSHFSCRRDMFSILLRMFSFSRHFFLNMLMGRLWKGI